MGRVKNRGGYSERACEQFLEALQTADLVLDVLCSQSVGVLEVPGVADRDVYELDWFQGEDHVQGISVGYPCLPFMIYIENMNMKTVIFAGGVSVSILSGTMNDDIPTEFLPLQVPQEIGVVQSMGPIGIVSSLSTHTHSPASSLIPMLASLFQTDFLDEAALITNISTN